MARKSRTLASHRLASEKGQVLVMAIVLLFLGSVLITPLLGLANVGFRTGFVYEGKTRELYAADAGIEDATWQIKYDRLEYLLTSPAYNPYDYSTVWDYNLPAQVNAEDVAVTIMNIWIPRNVPVPNAAQAGAIIEGQKLLVTSSSIANLCTIKITYNPGASEELKVESLGVWLPRGFTYTAGSSNLEVNPSNPYYSVPVVQPHAGNQAILWTFHSVPLNQFPGVHPEQSPMVAEVTFRFSSTQPGGQPAAVAWITTSGVADIPYSWDADIIVYKIISQAGDTSIEAYTAKEELRRLESTIAGDYRALGNSLMIDINHDAHGVRDQLLANSSATVSDIPSDADVGAAYLYWSAWRSDSNKITAFSDTCSNFNNWNYGSSWNISSGRFRGHYGGGADSTRYLTLKNNINLSSYTPGTVMVSWDQSEDGTLEAADGLDFAFSSDGGITWGSNIQAFRDDIGSSAVEYKYIIPAQYLTVSFKMRFYLQSFGDASEYGYIDNIAVVVMPPDTSVIFKIDGQQVYFDAGGVPQQGAQPLTASRSQVLANASGINGFSYSCYKDVTDLVKTFSVKQPDPAINHTGNGTYTIGDVSGNTGTELSYAGWSLIIIYSSAETEGHQLYLYDQFIYASGQTNIDFDKDGQPGGYISGFIVPNPIGGEVNAARLTVFVGEGDECYAGDQLKFSGTALSNAQSPSNNVWNGKSPGLTADGVDIDTFNVTWSSGLLDPGDTSAHIDLPTQIDNWNLVYIILSFRSETTTGGSLSYLIR